MVSPVATKPEKPDDQAYKCILAESDKDLLHVNDQLTALRLQISNGQGKNQIKVQELREKLDGIRARQAAIKALKSKEYEQAKILEDSVKRKVKELQSSKANKPFKSIEELDSLIGYLSRETLFDYRKLEEQVDSGTMKIVEEKKTLVQISNYKRMRKTTSTFMDQQTAIDREKAELKKVREQMEDAETMKLAQEANILHEELAKLKVENEVAYKSRSELFEQRASLQQRRDELWSARKAVQQENWEKNKEYREWETAEKQRRWEKKQLERETMEREKRQKAAQRKLEEASEEAYGVEIVTCQNYFDRGSEAAVVEQKAEDFVRRDISAPEGQALQRKGEEAFMMMGGGKKKGKKQGRGASDKYSLQIGVLAEFGKVDVSPPYAREQIGGVVEQLKARLGYYRENQKRVTEERVARVKREIEEQAREGVTEGVRESDGVESDGLRE
ncbi:hypothetical protein NEOLI_003416 [Neolecta irregularis DAH-3]|uniref:Nuclear segregation protein BFR1 n=1 Tax=Neolecta irregularis (strain DAH-3) TaxID=1198029 RepID=A0A1U7LMS5_NEOID|nr:hypothetical protein NEOLI_003416 [Neolecta irregularis DAH-3]|eukprot:OLL23970.1 hypothetical protein NEOLI_003416 [Neolecta irregularis DAH-3]